MQDNACTGTPCKGSVYRINYQSMTVEGVAADALFQPHGIIVDADNQYAWIANRNVDATGIPPHHGSTCSGNDGFLSRLDLSTGQLTDFRLVLSTDTYGIDAR